MKPLCVLFSCLGLLLHISSVLSAKVSDYTFTHLGVDEGVVGPHIFTICQTKDGAVWWSTKNTVDRYNGSSVRNYYLDADAPYNRFSGRAIGLVISNDLHSGLYAFDNKGKIFLYNRISDDFLPVADLELMLGRPVILYHIYIDKNGIWAALGDGVFRLENEILHPVLMEPARYIMAADDSYLFCTENGVYFQESLVAHATLFSPFRAESAYYDKESGRIWLGTFSDGVKVLDRNGTFNVQNLPNNPVRCIIADNEENLLVGVDGFGVYKVPSKGDRLSARLMMHANEGEQGVLHGNGVYALLKDIWGNIFVGTYSGGVDIARPTGGIVEVFQPNNKHINCVSEVPGWGIILGTDDGLSLKNEKYGKWKNLADGLVVLDVCEDADGGLLLATYGKGVFHLSKEGVVSQRYSLAGGRIA